MPSKQPLNASRVAQLHDAMRQHVERGDIPGIVTLVARGDDVHVNAVGTLTIDGKAPIRRDTIFRVASITKPIAAAAAMMLVDDGKLRLEDAIEPWLPELANRKVLRSIESPLDDTVAAKRAISVRDVLTYCFGFGSVMAMPGTHPIQQPIAEGHLGGDGPPQPALTPATDEWMRRLGDLPLMYQPGERWAYNTGGDVLGVLIARVAGQSFGDFLRERMFGPLGMKDTAFSVPASSLDRLPGCYAFNHASQKLEVFDNASAASDYSRPPAFESGAGGLVSTVDDYFAFSRMMLDKGMHKGVRLLSEASVEAMTRDQLTPVQRQGTEIFFGDHSSWGLGMGVNIRQSLPWTVPGRFGWDGGFDTSAWSDPANDFIGILLTQRLMDSPAPPAVFTDFWTHAYRAL
ncbi:serine hydrolase domain-containing protein [Variovorax sp. J22R133]|uniref:serine hydrolase domain-containing protein n=1 Tax=Variovorax brevis TaxID=3053503 RepID=UPI002578D59C|nr:serine hydrolase domain-containing protein [Variovorax sp. J22R133]MDM0112045.1 serine hydrolase domain-containing protein [Variovorax sp. J22R133]